MEGEKIKIIKERIKEVDKERRDIATAEAANHSGRV